VQEVTAIHPQSQAHLLFTVVAVAVADIPEAGQLLALAVLAGVVQVVKATQLKVLRVLTV